MQSRYFTHSFNLPTIYSVCEFVCDVSMGSPRAGHHVGVVGVESQTIFMLRWVRAGGIELQSPEVFEHACRLDGTNPLARVSYGFIVWWDLLREKWNNLIQDVTYMRQVLVNNFRTSKI